MGRTIRVLAARSSTDPSARSCSKKGRGLFEHGENPVARPILLLLVIYLFALTTQVHAAVQQRVYVTGHIHSFGGYAFSEAVAFELKEPGLQEVGRIVVDGLYNGEYPWIMRAYTDNMHFAGVSGAIKRPSPAGLVSKDGMYVIPLNIHSPAFGENVWRRVPDVTEPNSIAYRPSAAHDEEPTYTDCILMGIDPRNTPWVTGPDGLLYTADDSPIGDITVGTPFELILQADVPPNAVKGSYETFLYIEIVSSP